MRKVKKITRLIIIIEAIAFFGLLALAYGSLYAIPLMHGAIYG